MLTLYQRYYTEVGPEIMNAMLFEMSQNSPAMVAIGQNAVKKNIARDAEDAGLCQGARREAQGCERVRAAAAVRPDSHAISAAPDRD